MAKNYILWPTFLLQKVLVYLQPLLRNPSEFDEITLRLGLVRAITPFKVSQGHRFWYQSEAHMRLPISH